MTPSQQRQKGSRENVRQYGDEYQQRAQLSLQRSMPEYNPLQDTKSTCGCIRQGERK